MKANYLSAIGATALLVTLASAAIAADTANRSASSTPTVDRAQVKAEARAAEQSGAIPRGQQNFSSLSSTGSTVDRTALNAETAAYVKAKQPVWLPSNGIYFQGNSMKSVATRADVNAATVAAMKNQEIPRGEAQMRSPAQ